MASHRLLRSNAAGPSVMGIKSLSRGSDAAAKTNDERCAFKVGLLELVSLVTLSYVFQQITESPSAQWAVSWAGSDSSWHDAFQTCRTFSDYQEKQFNPPQDQFVFFQESRKKTTHQSLQRKRKTQEWQMQR